MDKRKVDKRKVDTDDMGKRKVGIKRKVGKEEGG